MKKYAVDINGKIVKWKDGKFECDDAELLKEIKDAAVEFSKNPAEFISLDGSIFGSGGKYNPEKSWAGSFALLQEITGTDMKFIAGDRPTWEAMGYKLQDGAIP